MSPSTLQTRTSPQARRRTVLPRRARTVLVRASFTIGAMLVTLLLAEGVMRTGLLLQGTPHDAHEVTRRVRRLVDPSGALVPPGHDEAATIERTNSANPLEPEARKPLLHPFTGAE